MPFAKLRSRSDRFDDERLNQKVYTATLKKLESVTRRRTVNEMDATFEGSRISPWRGLRGWKSAQGEKASWFPASPELN